MPIMFRASRKVFKKSYLPYTISAAPSALMGLSGMANGRFMLSGGKSYELDQPVTIAPTAQDLQGSRG